MLLKIKFDRKVSIITIGALLEYYNFILFGLLVPYIFSGYETEKVSLALGYLIFATGYIARPFGGALAGFISDYKGRKYGFSIIMIFSGVATILMGLVPYFSSFVLFFASFFILRIIQSIGYGGEIPNAVTILYEYDRNKKFLHTANVIFNATLGAIFAFATVYVISNIDKKYEMDKFLWRVPLIVSGVLTLILFFLRTNHPNFLGRKKEEVGQLNMFIKIIKSKIHLIFIGILMILPMAILNINNIFLPTYLSQHFAYNKSDITLIITMGLVFSLFCTISSGILLDKFNYKKLYPLVTSVLVSYIIYIVSYSGFKSFVTVILFNLIYNMYISFVIVMSLGLLSDLLSKEVRNTAIGFVYNVSFVIASLVPSISIELFKEFGEPLLIYYCFLFVIFISFISTMVYLNNYNENR